MAKVKITKNNTVAASLPLRVLAGTRQADISNFTFMTNQQWQLAARARLQTAGHEEPHAAARLTLDWATGKQRAALLNPDANLSDETLQKLENALCKLEARVPFPHISGRASFYNLEFEVSPATLIPRPETEWLVEAALKRLPSHARVADLGTGSGAIAIAIKKTRPDCQIWATEISPDAREIARRNANHNHALITVLEGTSDWLTPLNSLKPLDGLVSNPPYIAAAAIDNLQPEVALYEPRGALDGGADGLDPYRIFAEYGRDYLNKGGFCAVELGDEQWEKVRQLFVTNGWAVETAVYDLQNIPRVLVARHA